MGYSPREVDEMSLWEFRACYDGFAISKGLADPVEAPSDEEFWQAVNGEGKWQRLSAEPV